jgi:hypothetical protein
MLVLIVVCGQTTNMHTCQSGGLTEGRLCLVGDEESAH